MKKELLLFASILSFAITFAQTVPQGINYQAIARDATGIELTNQALTIQLSVIADSSTGSIIWQETDAVNTNDFGLFNTIIGKGISTTVGSSLTFSDIDWGSTSHYIKVELDLGTGYMNMGTSELMSVPYALSAGTSEDNLWHDDGAGNISNDNIGTVNIEAPQVNIGDGNQGIILDNTTDLTIETSNQIDITTYNFDLDAGDVNILASKTSIMGGNVGIGTDTPIRGKLEISGNAPCCGTTQGDFWYYLYNVPNGQFQYYNGSDNFDISVYADGRFMGSGIHIFSDERIKDIVSLSNNKNDLSTLLNLEITDYKLKDKAKSNKPYKKVIAQQVMSVYPQAVSLTTEVVPDIYTVSTIKEGYISLHNNLKKGERVKLIFEDEASLFDVLSADKHGFQVASNKSGQVFVYGREVDDFHSVDYESLSMLNISATQELYKLITQQQKTIKDQNTQIAEMQVNFDDRLKDLEQILNTSTLNR